MFQSPYALNKDNLLRVQKEKAKAKETVIFSLEDVQKAINEYISKIRQQIDKNNINNSNDSEEDYNTNNEEYIHSNEAERNQTLINLEMALMDGEIKGYKNEPFLVQMFVPSQDKKDIIDSVHKEITRFVMSQCGYPQFRLEVINTNPNDKKVIATSPIERFKVLMEISPAINTLKEKFKCEIKY